MARMVRKLMLVPILVTALYAFVLDAPAKAPSQPATTGNTWQATPAYPALESRPYGVGTGRRMK